MFLKNRQRFRAEQRPTGLLLLLLLLLLFL